MKYAQSMTLSLGLLVRASGSSLGTSSSCNATPGATGSRQGKSAIITFAALTQTVDATLQDDAGASVQHTGVAGTWLIP